MFAKTLKMTVLLLMIVADAAVCATPVGGVVAGNSPVRSLATIGEQGGAGPAGAKLVDASVDNDGNLYILSGVRDSSDYYGRPVRFYLYKYATYDNQWRQVRQFDACETASPYVTPSELSLGTNGDVWMIGRPQSSGKCVDDAGLVITQNGVVKNVKFPSQYTPKAIKIASNNGELTIAGVSAGANSYAITAYRMDPNYITRMPAPILVKSFSDLNNVPGLYFKLYLTNGNAIQVLYLVNAGNRTIYNNLATLMADGTFRQIYSNLFSVYSDYSLDEGIGNLYFTNGSGLASYAVAWNPNSSMVLKKGSKAAATQPFNKVELPDDMPRAFASASGAGISIADGKYGRYLAYISTDLTLQMYQLGGGVWKTAFAGDLNGAKSDGVKLLSVGAGHVLVVYDDLDENGITAKFFNDYFCDLNATKAKTSSSTDGCFD